MGKKSLSRRCYSLLDVVDEEEVDEVVGNGTGNWN